MLVTDLTNVRYLAGFTGSHGVLLVYADDRDAVLATDSRYRTQASEQVPDLDVLIDPAAARCLSARAVTDGIAALGFESHVLTVDAHAALARVVAEHGPTELVRAPGMVELLREVKDQGEVALLRLACEAADAALYDLLQQGGLRPGRTERQVQRDIESLMFAHGADAPSFETIVASGVHSAIPHHRPTDAVLTAGTFVKIDFGALVAGYHSDMTRTFVLGPVAEWQREVYAVVAQAQQAGRSALAAGVALRDIDAAARAVIAEAGHADHFGHGLGHGVGLQIHEAPGLGSTATGILRPGSVVTIEPGVYLPGRGGVRIEDTMTVPENGSPEPLTRFPRELIVV